MCFRNFQLQPEKSGKRKNKRERGGAPAKRIKSQQGGQESEGAQPKAQPNGDVAEQDGQQLSRKERKSAKKRSKSQEATQKSGATPSNGSIVQEEKLSKKEKKKSTKKRSSSQTYETIEKLKDSYTELQTSQSEERPKKSKASKKNVSATESPNISSCVVDSKSETLGNLHKKKNKISKKCNSE